MFLQAAHQVAKTSTTTGLPWSSWARGAPTELAFEAQGLAFEAQGLAFEAQGLAFEAQGLAFEAQGLVLVVAELDATSGLGLAGA